MPVPIDPPVGLGDRFLVGKPQRHVKAIYHCWGNTGSMSSDMLVALEDIVHGFSRKIRWVGLHVATCVDPVMNILEAKSARALDTSNSAPTDGAGRLAKRTGHGDTFSKGAWDASNGFAVG